MANGILAGLVSVTAPCANIEPYAAFIIGLIGSIVYFFISKLVKIIKIDDPLDAFAVHYGAGMWGILSVGAFDLDYGFYYGHGGKQLGT